MAELTFAEERVPLAHWDDGSVRVGKTRINLEILIEDYRLGHSPEEMVEMHPTLDLGDVYLVIGYCLRRKEEVDALMREWDEAWEETKAWINAQPGQQELRHRVRERARKRSLTS